MKGELVWVEILTVKYYTRWCWVEILDSGFLVVKSGEDVSSKPDNLIETYFSEEYIVKSESTVDDIAQ